MKNYLWGIDLGGTKIEGIVLDAEDYDRVICRERIPTEAEKGYDHILKQISRLVDILSEKAGYNPQKIGIGTPGSIDPQTQTLKNSNSTVLNGKTFRADLAEELGISLSIANDANCFALAETTIGIVPEVKPGAEVVFGVIMGTGVGGGVVVNNKVINGLQGIAGEWGHTYLDDSGGKCYCGDTGCIETIISGPALEKYYQDQSGLKKDLKEIVTQYKIKQDNNAIKTVERLLTFFGKGLSNVINILDPDIVVLGGGLSNIDILYTEGLEYLKKHVFNTSFHTPITKPKLGDSAGVYGAAFLVR